MAIENEQELAAAVERLAKLMEGGNSSFAEMEKQLKQSNVGLKAFGKALAGAPGDIARGMGTFSKQLGNGDSSLKTFNTVIDTAAGAAGGLAKTIPVMGDALAASIRAVAEASKFVVDQLDATAKSFNDISEVGAAMGDGMTGLRRQFENSGLSLQQYTKVIKANSETMAQFRGLTGKGAEDFSSIVGELTQGSDDSLRRLGLSADQIGSTTAAYVKQQTLLGRAQYTTNEQLRKGTVEYAKELDILSKITGQNREAIQAQQDAALSESRFRAVYERMMSSGQEDAAKAMMSFQTVVSGLSKEAGQGIRDLSSGIVDSAAAQKLFNSTNGAALDIVERLKNGQITQAQAQQELTSAINANIPRMQDQAQYNKDAAEQQIGLADAYKLGRARFDANNEVIVEARKEQEKQIKATDQLTKDTVTAQKALEGMAIEVNKMAMVFMPSAATAVQSVSTAMRELFKTVREEVEKKETKPLSGGKGAAAGAAALGTAGAVAGSIIPGVGTVVGGAIGAAVGGIAGSLGMIDYGAKGNGPPEVKPEDYISFSSGTGSKDHFDKLQPNVQSAFMQMARDYNQLTGKKLQINSAYRSIEEQANVDSGKNPKAAPGMSLHNQGRALDIQSNQRSELEGLGLLSQYGFKPLANDPPHISMADGGVLSGPTGGYKPNLTMHGSEAIVPLPDGRSIPVTDSGKDIGVMSAQLDKLDEMVSVLKSQLTISTKLLQMQS